MVKTSFFDHLSFHPGPKHNEHLIPEDIAEAVSLVLKSRDGAVFDEISISPHKKHICFKKRL